MNSTTEGPPDDSTESAVDQAKRNYTEAVNASTACTELARSAGNAATAHGYLYAAQVNATLAQAAATRLQAEHLERLTAAVVSAVQAAAQLGAALPPVVRAFQEIAGQLARQADAAEANLAWAKRMAGLIGASPVVSAEDPDLRGLLSEHLRKVYPSTAAGAPPFVCRSRIRVDDGGPMVVMCRRPEPHAVNGRHTSGHDVFGRVWMWSGDDPRVVSPDGRAPAPKRPESPQEAPEAPDPQSGVDGAVSPASGEHSGPRRCPCESGSLCGGTGWLLNGDPRYTEDPDGPMAGGHR